MPHQFGGIPKQHIAENRGTYAGTGSPAGKFLITRLDGTQTVFHQGRLFFLGRLVGRKRSDLKQNNPSASGDTELHIKIKLGNDLFYLPDRLYDIPPWLDQPETLRIPEHLRQRSGQTGGHRIRLACDVIVDNIIRRRSLQIMRKNNATHNDVGCLALDQNLVQSAFCHRWPIGSDRIVNRRRYLIRILGVNIKPGMIVPRLGTGQRILVQAGASHNNPVTGEFVADAVKNLIPVSHPLFNRYNIGFLNIGFLQKRLQRLKSFGLCGDDMAWAFPALLAKDLKVLDRKL